ncbi:tRNA lysidine(34) synthetase TilS [Chryseobacterium sp.]|uniref:tRNA lysidine(34) synthetase TilS n=1 Tax=Chryseobacterium sp. TaxID=1871047 RepID=UPI0011CA3F51|nr:tRNA lysidine(34) synthetase TilS [Chryseobacterium sp.]TXF77243.1 tRNA lysidine(34) synthetase TilS [Chryseobacterium sp.]
MLTTENFLQQMEEICPHFSDGNFLLAVSGGADSMVLLHLFQTSGLNFQVAHLNYKLRAKNSDLDQKTVEDFCKINHIPFHLYQLSEKDKKPKNSIQNWARDLRYGFFRKIQEKENLEFLVTAHHLNDQLETFIINLSKASGIRGLTGIPANENQILRPLLSFSKDEIYAFAEAHDIEFREDLSNQKSDYLRNKIRNEITPKLLETNAHFLQNFSKSIGYLKLVKDFTDKQAQEAANKFIAENGNGIFIDKAKFLNQHYFVQFEILRRFGFDKEKEIRKILDAENGKTFHSGTHTLFADRDHFILKNSTEINSINSNEEIFLEVEENTVIIPQNYATTKNPSSFEWFFDAEKLTFPLKLRKKRAGDTFYPIGMIGKKKISKFCKDEKLSIFAHEIWLLCDANDDVLGVVPFRQDRRFSSEENTKKILQVKIQALTFPIGEAVLPDFYKK